MTRIIKTYYKCDVCNLEQEAGMSYATGGDVYEEIPYGWESRMTKVPWVLWEETHYYDKNIHLCPTCKTGCNCQTHKHSFVWKCPVHGERELGR